ncbi:MAG: hypothetical protein ACI4HM_10585 [Ruminococcus sp.]
MKKLLSLTLSVVIALSILIIPMGTGATTNSKKAVKTYVAKSDEYFTSYGRAYSQGRKLYFHESYGETYLLTNHSGNAVSNFYVRGDTVYYCKLGNVFSVSTTGTNRKKLYGKFNAKMLGGYGSSVIFIADDENNRSTVYKIKNGKTFTLFTRSDVKDVYESKETWDVTLFSGRIYFNEENKVYDLATNKVKSFKASQIVGTKNYLYYVNRVNNLRRIDKYGTNQLLSKNITKIYTANDARTIVYGKKNPATGKEYLYRKTAIYYQTYRLCSVETLGATLGVEEKDTVINKSYFIPGKVYLLINERIVLSVGSRGGTPNVLCKAEGEYERCNLFCRYGEVHYGIVYYDADDFNDD